MLIIFSHFPHLWIVLCVGICYRSNFKINCTGYARLLQRRMESIRFHNSCVRFHRTGIGRCARIIGVPGSSTSKKWSMRRNALIISPNLCVCLHTQLRPLRLARMVPEFELLLARLSSFYRKLFTQTVLLAMIIYIFTVFGCRQFGKNYKGMWRAYWHL